jgi:hypothetical protein
MTDRDDSSKGFLERWSRKKIDAERETPAKAAPKETSPAAAERPPERQTKSDAESPVPDAPKPEFDLASLPSLDSITAATDIRAFLTPGVPTELAHAALRRAWAADPAIRDFKGLAENAWDFTDPTAMPGFGALPPGTDIKKMLAQIFGDGEKPVTADGADTMKEKLSTPETPGIAEHIALPEPSAEAGSATEEKAEPSPPEITAGRQQMVRDDFVQRDNNIASHNNSSNDETEEPQSRRHHGGALPQ